MGWERRRNQLYYYAKERIGRRVISICYGNGDRAEIVSELTARQRADRDEARAQDMAECARLQEEDAKAGEIFGAVNLLTKAALLASGHHMHKRSWRRIRHAEKTTEGRG